ncbi:hypothetical protein T484DRAFT_1769896 [Baffinella frigidus]|nr:hypothetical protein T484DRAFT_1769896 [Cryptophyta sp. CCMP2293]
MLVYVRWQGSLEPLYCHEKDKVADLRRRLTAEANVPLEHKLLVHKGLLLEDDMTLEEVLGRS